MATRQEEVQPLVKPEPRFQDNPAHQAFIEALLSTYNLHQFEPEQLRWADVKPNVLSVYYPPTVQVSVAETVPSFGTSVVAVEGDNVVSSPHYAALFFRDVAPLSLRADLKKYEIVKVRGRLREQDEMIKDGPITLDRLLEKMRDRGHNIPDTTAVVEMVSVLPVAPNGEFRTEFHPTVKVPYNDFSFPHIVQDGIVYASLVSGSGKLDLLDLKEDNTTHRFKAEYVPSMDSIEKLFVPDSAGHMVVLALPVNVKREDFFKYLDGLEDYGHGEGFRGGGLNFRSFGGDMMKGGGTYRGSTLGPTRPAEMGRINIGRGSKTDVQTREADVQPDPSRVGAIYHVLFIGMKPDTAVDNIKLAKIGQALDSYRSR